MFVTVLPRGYTGVVKFTATWCGPCRGIAKALEETCAQKSTNLVEVDVDSSESELAAAFAVNAMPTLVFMENGQEVEYLRVVGASMAQITQSIDQLASRVSANQISLPVETAAAVECHPPSSH